MHGKAEQEFSDEEFAQAYILSADPEEHVRRIREIEDMGASVVCLQNASGADSLGALEVYGKSVLPALRARQAAAAAGAA